MSGHDCPGWNASEPFVSGVISMHLLRNGRPGPDGVYRMPPGVLPYSWCPWCGMPLLNLPAAADLTWDDPRPAAPDSNPIVQSASTRAIQGAQPETLRWDESHQEGPTR